MHELLKRFHGYMTSGDVEYLKPIPKYFTFKELEYLYNEGYITVIGNEFVSVCTLEDIQGV